MTPDSVVDVLVKARALIEKPENWGQGLSCSRPNTLCAGQALDRLGAMGSGASAALARAMGCWSIVMFNDRHSHSEVLAAFDRAIASARATEERP